MAIIMAIFLYSAWYKQNTHPIPALLTQKTGIIPPSKGLSAGFSEIVRGNFTKALELNQHSIRIFGFFLIQFLFRILLTISINKHKNSIAKIAIFDICISIILFSVCFAPLISYTLRLFAQLLH
ncbi:MAG: hypothetical protein AB7S48_14280 [Bacteroidales bacterium]